MERSSKTTGMNDSKKSTYFSFVILTYCYFDIFVFFLLVLRILPSSMQRDVNETSCTLQTKMISFIIIITTLDPTRKAFKLTRRPHRPIAPTDGVFGQTEGPSSVPLVAH